MITILASGLRRVLPYSSSKMFWAMLPLAVLLVVGCNRESGIPRSEVYGLVTVGGQPVAEGGITLEPMPGVSGPNVGAPIKEGKYNIQSEDGPIPGRYKAYVKGWQLTGKMIDLPPDSVNPEGESLPERIQVTAKGGGPLKPIEVVITSGENELDIVIPNE